MTTGTCEQSEGSTLHDPHDVRVVYQLRARRHTLRAVGRGCGAVPQLLKAGASRSYTRQTVRRHRAVAEPQHPAEGKAPTRPAYGVHTEE